MAMYEPRNLLDLVEYPGFVVGGGVVANGHPHLGLLKSVDDFDFVEEDKDAATGSTLENVSGLSLAGMFVTLSVCTVTCTFS